MYRCSLNFFLKAINFDKMQKMTIEQVQNQIIEEFEVFDDWMDKYNFLIELSKELAPFPVEKKTDEYVIKGCQSRVWLDAVYENNTITYYADSDAIITKGIISLLIRVWSGRSPKEIMDSELFFIDSIGLKQNLSPTRSNGLLAMVKQMKLYALAYHTKYSNE